MTYEFLSWQTINLPAVSGDTSFIIYDHTTSTPGTDVSGIVYSGLVLDGYSLNNLDEILSQYVFPQEISFSSSGHTQVDSTMYKHFYIYYSIDDWTTYTSDTVIITYDWSYNSNPKSNLSDPIINLLDARQFVVWSKKPASPDISQNILVTLNGRLEESFTITGYNTWNYVAQLNSFTYQGEFTYAYSYDYFVDSNLPVGDFAVLQIGNQKYYVALTCNRYCLYYLNQYGGWDSLLFAGSEKQSDNLSRLSYKKNYVSQSLDFHKVDYLTTIGETWSLNTSYLDDSQSLKMINVLASNKLYLHDLVENKIIPVNITNSVCEHKTWKNQGRKLSVYTLEVAASQNKYRV